MAGECSVGPRRKQPLDISGCDGSKKKILINSANGVSTSIEAHYFVRLLSMVLHSVAGTLDCGTRV